MNFPKIEKLVYGMGIGGLALVCGMQIELDRWIDGW